MSAVITPPPGYGASVAVDRAGAAERRRDIALIVFVYVVIAAGFTFTRGFFWPALVILALAAAGTIAVLNRGWIAAGPDWLKLSGGRWVATSRLVRVSARSTTGGNRVFMEDADGRHLEVRLEELTRTPDVWRAFAEGLARSREHGVQIDAQTRAQLAAADFTGTLR